MLRTSGCPAIDGSKDCLSAVSPGALRRPLRVRRLHRHGQDRPGSLAPARNAVTRKAVRNGGGGKHGFPDDGWTDGRADLASAGGRRDADLFRVFRVFRGKHHLTTFCCRKPRWQVNCIIPKNFPRNTRHTRFVPPVDCFCKWLKSRNSSLRWQKLQSIL